MLDFVNIILFVEKMLLEVRVLIIIIIIMRLLEGFEPMMLSS